MIVFRSNLIYCVICTALLCNSLLCNSLSAQTEANPVYVADSPEAAKLFFIASEQRQTGNLSETVRIYHELLKSFAYKLIEVSDLDKLEIVRDSDYFVTVRSIIKEILTRDPELLEAYRKLQEPFSFNDRVIDIANDGDLTQLDRSELESITLSTVLSEAGFEAGMILAQQYLMGAEFFSSLRMLRDIAGYVELNEAGDVTDQTRQWVRLLLLAGLYGGNDAAYEDGLSKLRSLGFAADIEQAQRYNADFARPAIQSYRTTDDYAAGHDQPSSEKSINQPTLSLMSRRPVWRQTLETSLTVALSRPEINDSQRRSIRADINNGQYLANIPAVCDDQVLINDGISLVALDRFDGSQLWRFVVDRDLSAGQILFTHTNPWDGVSISAHGVAATYDSVVAIMWNGRQDDQEYDPSRLINLDRKTGKVKWEVLPGQLFDEFRSGIFTGLPVIKENLIYVVVRTLEQQLGCDYLVAIDLEDGHLVWQQYLASSAVGRGSYWLPNAQPLWFEGELFISSPLGCIASVDARTGLVNWLRVMPPEPDSFRFSEPRVWAYDIPLVTRVGLVTFTPDRHGIVVLDPASGKTLSYNSRNSWGKPEYLLADDEYIYGIGTNLSRISLDQLGNPKLDILSIDSTEPIIGRAMLCGVDNKLIVPTLNRLMIVDGLMGDILESNGLEHWGIPLVVGAEVLIANMDGVDSYIPYSVGEPILTTKLRAFPHDPSPAVSLVTLAFQHRRLDRIVQMTDIAIEAINVEPLSEISRRNQSKLFDRLLEIAPHPAINDTEVAEALFMRLNSLVGSAEQRVSYLLTYGSYLEVHERFSEAVDVYQSIINDALLASTHWLAPFGRVRSQIEVTKRLSKIIDTQGRNIYALYDDLARREIRQYIENDSITGLLGLADKYPVSDIAAIASMEAAQRLVMENKPDYAVRVLRKALSLAVSDEEIYARVLGALLVLLEQQDLYKEALGELLTAKRSHENLYIVSNLRSMEINSWESHLRDMVDKIYPSAVIGTISRNDSVIQMEGQDLLLPRYGAASSSIVLVNTDRIIYALGGENINKLWNRIQDTDELELLVVDSPAEASQGARGLIWGWDENHHSTIESFSLETGETIWKFDTIDDLFRSINNWEMDNRLINNSRNRGYGPKDPLIAPVVGSQEVVVADSSGPILCIERDDGTLRWFSDIPLDLLTHLETGQNEIIVAGYSHQELSSEDEIAELVKLTSHILLIDPRTGDIDIDLQLPEDQNVTWVLPSETGELLYATGEVITCYDLIQHEVRWIIEDTSVQASRWPMIVGHKLLVTDMGGQELRLDITTGDLSQIEGVVLEGMINPEPKMYTQNGMYIIRASNGVFVFDQAGELIGNLARTGLEGVYLASIATSSDSIVIVQSVSNLSQPGTPRQLLVYQIDYTGKRISPEFQPKGDPPIPKRNAAQVIDNWIIVNAGMQILAFPAPRVEDQEGVRNDGLNN